MTDKQTAFIPAWLDDEITDLYEFRVYCHVARRGLCFESKVRMADKLKMSRRKLINTIASLKSKGLLEEKIASTGVKVYAIIGVHESNKGVHEDNTPVTQSNTSVHESNTPCSPGAHIRYSLQGTPIKDSDASASATQATLFPPESDFLEEPTPGASGMSTETLAGQSQDCLPPTPRDLLWQQGLGWLAKATGKKPQSLRSLIGRWCKDHGEQATWQAFVHVMGQSPPPLDAVSYLTETLKNQNNGGQNGHITTEQTVQRDSEATVARLLAELRAEGKV